MSNDTQEQLGSEDWRDEDELEADSVTDILGDDEELDEEIVEADIEDQDGRPALHPDHENFPTDPEVNTDQDMTRAENANLD